MKFKITLLFIISVLSISFVFGQDFYLSNGKTNGIEFGDINNHSITINNYTGYNAVIYNHGVSEIEKPILVVSLKENSFYHPVYAIKLEKKNSPSIYYGDINWKQDGDYKLSIMEGQKEISTNYYSVNVNEDDNLNISDLSDDYNKYNDPTNTFYYIDSKVEFYESVNEFNEPINLNSEFHLGNVSVLVSNNKPIIANELIVSVYKLKGKSNQVKVDEKKIPFNSGDLSVSFNYYFGIKGSFLVSVYTNDDIWINDGNIKIN